MIIQIRHNKKTYACDLSKPLDISISLGQVKCFYAPDLKMIPYRSGDFIGSVKAGAPVNFFNVTMNPHGNGTHTESLGHITLEQQTINQSLKQYHFMAQLVSVKLSQRKNGDRVITAKDLKKACPKNLPKALILRTIPNNSKKQTADYSGTNPPYLAKAAMEFIIKKGVEHLLLDLPSVDREEDNGKMENHKLFWNVKTKKTRKSSKHNHTITELILVPNEIKDGLYLLNIQIPSLELDAAPSKPVLYKLF